MTFPSYITVHDKSIKVHYIKKEKTSFGIKRDEITRWNNNTKYTIWKEQYVILLEIGIR